MSRQKRQDKQDEREIKRMEEILSGRVKVVYYGRASKPAQPNRKGGVAATAEEETEMTEGYARLLRALLPGIVAKLSRIEDPRDQRRIEHSLPLLMLFGILMFLSHCTSRRAANRELARSSLLSLVEEFVPGAKDMPHADTLARLLCAIDVEAIDRYYEELLRDFIKSKPFQELNPGRFLVTIDGTQKFSRRYQWDVGALNRSVGDGDKERHYVYVLESILILDNGMALPLLTEILENEESVATVQEKAGTTAGGEHAQKQDCETKAFHRLAQRLEKLLGKGCVNVVLDGIYASGPVISRCQNNGWGYMIVLKKDCLKTVWEEFNGLQRIETNNVLLAQWGQRWQEYRWINEIEYTYGKNYKRLTVNVVTCTETWVEQCPRSGKEPKTMETEYAWLSSSHLTPDNVFETCTKIARSRWRIENNFLVEKHQGYQYSHCYSYNWEAMKGFHYLMKFGIFLNVFITHSEAAIMYARIEGIQGYVKRIWESLRQGKWLTADNTEKTDSAVRGRLRIRFPKLKMTV